MTLVERVLEDRSTDELRTLRAAIWRELVAASREVARLESDLADIADVIADRRAANGQTGSE